MKTKIYKSLASAILGLFALALSLFSGAVYSQATYTFNYTGSIQTLSVGAGTYSIECWGALGGWHTLDMLLQRGRAGYANGTLTITSPTTLYIAVGGAGGTQTNNAVPGGWNGGGNAKYYSYSFNGGGGASHVATATGTLGALVSNTPAVLIVAGGGGGGASSQTPGNGGGLNGGNSTRSGCTGGTQTTPGASSIIGGNATFGLGWDGVPTSGSYGAGGGGWFGGGCESGGSSYIGGVSSGTTIMFGQSGYVPNPDVSGHGFVIIRELCSMTLYAVGPANSLNPSICAGQSATLMTNAISNFSWSTGATTSSLVVSPTSNTVYALTATSPSNCTASSSLSITVSSGVPVLAISNPSNNICLGQSATLTASGALSYTWSNAGVVNGQTFTPVSTAVYSVTGSNGCGTGSAVTTISVAPLVVTASSSPTIVCEGYTATLTAMSAVNGYTWEPGTLTTSLALTSPTATTIYTVTASDGICSGTQTVLITTKTTPTITASGSSSMICQGDQVVLSASGGTSYIWTPGNLSGSSVTVSPLTSTLFVVAGTNSLNCTSSANQVIIVTPSPTVSVIANKPVSCPGTEVILFASGANTYAWSGGPSTPVYSVYPTSATVYTVVGTQNNNPCTDTKTISVNVVVPNVTASSNTATCHGGSVQLMAGGATSYAWNGISGGTITVNPIATSVYTLVAQTNSGTVICPTTLTVLVTVHPNPTISVTAGRNVICKGESNTLTATGAANYTWQVAPGTGSTVVVKPNSTTTYTLSGTSTEGCTTQTMVTALVNSCNSMEEYGNTSLIKVYPNPNNGQFFVSSESAITLNLINTLGQIIRTVELNSENGFSVELSGLAKGLYYLSSASGLKQSEHIRLIVN